MPMTESELVCKQAAVMLREVIDPAVYPRSVRVEVGAHLRGDARAELISPERAWSERYEAVGVGYRWGPKWATCWFRVRGEVPEVMAGGTVGLRFSTATEGLVWRRGAGGWEPVQGLDVNRDFVRLYEQASGGEGVDLLVEAACNHPFGVTGFEWDDPDVHRRWSSPMPAVLERCDVVMRDPKVWELRQVFAFAQGLLKEMAEDAARAGELREALVRAMRAIGLAEVRWAERGVREVAQEQAEAIARALAGGEDRDATVCHAVGHAHLDTAWLWPVRETKRKCLRTFSNQIGLMERFPRYSFLGSQAQHYAWVEESCPALFAKIRERVEEGRWEAGGAMWVEADANCPSGESLVRQIVHGARYWTRRFGARGEQRFLFLPDTFGFPASMPQIMRLAGLGTFITNKLHWNATNRFPHTTFVWRGIDGSEVLAHNTPGADYNAVNTPKELRRGEKNYRETSVGEVARGEHARWLQPFGYGDGGGGPTDWSIRFAELSAACGGLPRVGLSTTDEFCEALARDRTILRARGTDFPCVEGELYLELHRGTLTTQGWIKRANRRAEESLRRAELLLVGGPRRVDECEADRAALDAAWKLVLLNQFHDILPGSSIGWVYEDSRKDFARVGELVDEVARRASTAWIGGTVEGSRGCVCVLNTCSSARRGVVEVGAGAQAKLIWVDDVPALGVRVVDVEAERSGPAPVVLRGRSLSNGVVSAEIDDRGRVCSLRCADGPDLARGGGARGEGLNQIWLHHDRPHMWDAWDIDESALEMGVPVESPAASIRAEQASRWRASVRVERALGRASRIVQTYVLEAGSPRLDVRTWVDWRERHTWLRALFPTAIGSPRASYEIQFGHVERSTGYGTPNERAMFEVCAHRWMDLSQAGSGLAILNDGKYGHSCRGGVLALSLLRSPTHPDPEADQGEHEFTYAMMPHRGDWRAAGVDREAEALNMPLGVLGAGVSGREGEVWSLLEARGEGGAGVMVSALKPSEDGRGIVLRVWESHGRGGRIVVDWKAPVRGVERVDVLERPLAAGRCSHEGGRTTVEVGAFEIVTLRCERVA